MGIIYHDYFKLLLNINKLPRILNPCQGNQSGDFDSDILVTQNILFLNVLSCTIIDMGNP